MKPAQTFRGKRILVQEREPVATAKWLLERGAHITLAGVETSVMKRIEEYCKRIARDGSDYAALQSRITWEQHTPKTSAFDLVVSDHSHELFLSAWQKPIIAVTGAHGKTMTAVWAAHLIGNAAVAGHVWDKPFMSIANSPAKMAVIEIHGIAPSATNVQTVNTNEFAEPLTAAKHAAQLAGTSMEDIEHRVASLPQVSGCQEVVERGPKVTVVNDSAATSPQRSLPALKRFGGPNCILVCGGAGGKADYRTWADELIQRIPKTNVVFFAGSATNEMCRALGYRGVRGIRSYDTPERCMLAAKRRAKHFITATILVSPAAKYPWK